MKGIWVFLRNGVTHFQNFSNIDFTKIETQPNLVFSTIPLNRVRIFNVFFHRINEHNFYGEFFPEVTQKTFFASDLFLASKTFSVRTMIQVRVDRTVFKTHRRDLIHFNP